MDEIIDGIAGLFNKKDNRKGKITQEYEIKRDELLSALKIKGNVSHVSYNSARKVLVIKTKE